MLILQGMPFFFTPVWCARKLASPKPVCSCMRLVLACQLMMMYAALRSYSEALGHPRPVTAISLLALLALIPLNLVFMYGFGPIPALGSAGCGFAAAILQWLMFITLAIYIRKQGLQTGTDLCNGKNWA
ncbi:MAG: hypothetical protein U1F28_00025 [Acinetobacter sp.]